MKTPRWLGRPAVTASIAAVGLLAAACAGSGADSGSKGGSLNVVYAQWGSNVTFSQRVTDSLVAAAQRADIKITVLDNRSDSATTISNARTAAARHPNLFVEYSPLSHNDQIASIMKDAGVPVLAVQVLVPGSPLFAIDNTEVGRLGGAGVSATAKKKWGSEPPTAALILNHQEGGPIDIDRGKGAVGAIQAEFPGLPIVQGDNKSDVNTAAQVMNGFLTSHPHGKLIVWCHLDQYAIAAANAAKSAGRASDVLIGSTGGDPTTVPFVKSGVFAGTVGLNPQTWGSQLVPLIKAAVNGKAPAVTRPTGAVFIDAQNVDTYLHP